MKITRSTAALLFVASLFFHAVAFADPFDACPEYVRYGIPSDKGDLLCRKGYALAHNPQRKTPDWVAERLTREKANTSRPRSDDFRPDPDLEPGHRADLADYKNSSYDRGHMAPAANMRWDKDAMSESFFLSNMAPQVGPGMNRGIWANLEGKVRAWAIKRGEVYIFTGPIYAASPDKTIGGNKVAVPTHFYKIVFDPIKVEAIAFIMPNQSLNTKDLPKYIASIDDVEAQTGLDFLSAVDKHVQNLIESRKANALWE
jgi:endonuclease G